MSTQGSGEILSGDHEHVTFAIVEGGPRVDRTTISNSYTGAIRGEGRQTVLIVFNDGRLEGRGSGRWVGMEQITGEVGDRSGSFIIQQGGTFDNTDDTEIGWEGEWHVVPGSGTGDFAGLSASGTTRFRQSMQNREYTIDYDFA